MDLQEKLRVNAQNYKRSLDRIIEKYSKLQQQEDVVVVDLNAIMPHTLALYMSQSQTALDQMEAQSLTYSSDESVRAHDLAEDTRLDFLPLDKSESAAWNVSSEEDGGVIRSDASQSSVSVVDLQPEDQEEELEKSLKCNPSLLELYPSMVSRLERAQQRCHVFEAADSVLRKYQKLRQQPQRSRLNDTYNVPLRHCRPKHMASVSSFTDARPQPQPTTRAQQWSPGRDRSPQRRAQQEPILIREPADSPHAFKPKKCSVNEPPVPVQRESSCSYASPSRLYSPAKRPSQPHTERAESYISPSRQGPFKPRKALISESSTRSPKACLPQGVPRELGRPRSMTTSSSPHRSAERAECYSSPSRQGLFKPRQQLLPESSTRSPTAFSPQGVLRELVRPRSMTTSSSPHRSAAAQQPHTECYSSPSRQGLFKPGKALVSESSTRSPKAFSPQGVPRELGRPRSMSTSSSPHRTAERAECYSSPSRQGLFKPRQQLLPESSTRSPTAFSPQGVPRELGRPRSMTTSSSPHRSVTAQKRLFPQDAPLFQPYPRSPRSSTARDRPRLSRHLSLDAFLPSSSHTSPSAKNLDEEFIKLFHRFVCQSKYSFFNSVPCRYCTKHPQASKKPSSSSLAALALSPVRPPLRKRVWEEDRDSSPGSKRYRHDYASSPGSRRRSFEMLRRFNVASGSFPRKYW